MVEDNEAMTDSYAMIDPLGRFYGDTGGRHRESAPILEVGLATALAQVGYSEEQYAAEKRAELTTEGGLDAVRLEKELTPYVKKLQDNGSRVSLFIDPDGTQVEAAAPWPRVAPWPPPT